MNNDIENYKKLLAVAYILGYFFGLSANKTEDMQIIE